MKHRGYIEGYYGRRLTWDQRREIVSCLRENGHETYIYAPKEDPFHRKSWKKDYQDAWFKNYNSFVSDSISSGVRVIPALAPGLSFDYTDKTDQDTLIKKALSLTCKTGAFALLMDDIPAKLPEKACSHFASLGEAHGRLLQDMSMELRGVEIFFCPTVYTDEFTENGILSSGYLKDLSEHIPDECVI
ncbi:MAG: beta-N-acetylglucosaminidase domain-containing protein, partial [Chitinivibrionales bacterium]